MCVYVYCVGVCVYCVGMCVCAPLGQPELQVPRRSADVPTPRHKINTCRATLPSLATRLESSLRRCNRPRDISGADWGPPLKPSWTSRWYGTEGFERGGLIRAPHYAELGQFRWEIFRWLEIFPVSPADSRNIRQTILLLHVFIFLITTKNNKKQEQKRQKQIKNNNIIGRLLFREIIILAVPFNGNIF